MFQSEHFHVILRLRREGFISKKRRTRGEQRQHIIQPHYYCVCTIQLRLFISYHTYEIDSDWPQPSPEYHSPCRGACCPRFALATRIFKKKRTYISTYHTHTWVAHVYRHPLIVWIVTHVPVPVQTQLIPRSLAKENFRKVRKLINWTNNNENQQFKKHDYEVRIWQ